MKNRIATLLILMLVAMAAYAGPKMHVVKFSINPSDWVHQAPDMSALSFRVEDKNLTKEVFENGTVMIYVLGTSGGGWWPLPHTYPSGSVVSYNYLPGYVEVRLYGAQPNITWNYKMVILSGK